MMNTPQHLSAASLVALSDQAAQLSAGQWSVALLNAAFPQVTTEDILALPVGARDQRIISVRAGITAGPLRAEPICDACGATYELTLDPRQLGLVQSVSPDIGYRKIEIDDKVLDVRPVTVADLLAVEQIVDAGNAADVLKSRVVEGDEDVSLAALETALEALDPVADIWLTTACPECSIEQAVAFDPVHFVALEVRQAATRVLNDVVDIAHAFHWSEKDILALPESRRAYYVAEALA